MWAGGGGVRGGAANIVSQTMYVEKIKSDV